MAIRVALNHLTRYRYDRPVGLSPQIIRLRPAPHCRTPVAAYSLVVEPGGHFINWQQDPQSNYLARVVFPEKVTSFSVEVDLVAELRVINPFDFFLEPDAERFPFDYEPWLARELRPFLETLPVEPLLADWLATVSREPRRTADFLVDLNQRLQRDVAYVVRMEPGVQTCQQTLALGSGSCRDSAWLLVQILRNLGLAARFVSGYLIQLVADQKPLDGPGGPSADFTDLHAWAEVYLPGAGWVGLDPTSGLFASEGHLPLAATPDPLSAAPVSGSVDACEVAFEHAMRVERIHEDPRVTKPYTDAQWQRIETLGDRIDADLEAGDVRLTMGGEPTFVSLDDVDGDQWNTTALGDDKRRLAEVLLRRLVARWAAGGLLHFGQGKWYPGEPLPRWALACFWRKDGEPIWNDPSLLLEAADEPGNDWADAERFTRALAERLACDPDHARLAYEDPWHHIAEEGRLPINVDVFDNKLDRVEERVRLRHVFERGLAEPVGVVLPLARVPGGDGPRWQSGLWMLRSQHLTLIPGDSPLGLRLPLSRLPWQDPDSRPYFEPYDPTAPRPPLAPRPPQAARAQSPTALALGRRPTAQHVNEQRLGYPERVPALGESADWVVRTAMCVEVRGGRLYVFMPPCRTAEDYLELVAAVEATAASTALRVIVEGYRPPADHRIEVLGVTPDPGVIEVNVPPSRSWRELVERTTTLYDEARAARLTTEKFMLDGRHTGTGGGNHVVVGGPTPADSPLLRRPDLLRSLLAYWLNHPSLSYLFSGMFIGPTSQAPRVDEARHESVYELEIAFREIPDSSAGECPPWLVDRVFRHLLTDVTGNTHRSEFCIDKLYAPETSTGRLGLLELRAFEMPPHARMSLVQQLLLRALIAWFWREPYARPPLRWGTQLHDRFMLPYFVDRDLCEVIDDLTRAGYEVEREWFAPHFEFRFPIIGRVAPCGVDVELRFAIEPWHVLGEEPVGGAQARYVDSSTERLQVRVRGLTGDRHRLACNGRALPLQPTGTHGEWVAGVRYKAWAPPSSLHPTVPVHTPLVFDLVDVAAGRSVGGCTYHVMHPGGRSYETFAVNAGEAEARRVARFQPFGHHPGSMSVAAARVSADFPLTLDLRRFEG
jgi:uncharacterized protein (DUF2126 family)